MITLTATSARSNWFQLLKKTAKGHLPTKISSKEGNVVMISEDEYESLLETAELMSIPKLSESIAKSDQEIKNGEVLSLEEVFKGEK